MQCTHYRLTHWAYLSVSHTDTHRLSTQLPTELILIRLDPNCIMLVCEICYTITINLNYRNDCKACLDKKSNDHALTSINHLSLHRAIAEYPGVPYRFMCLLQGLLLKRDRDCYIKKNVSIGTFVGLKQHGLRKHNDDSIFKGLRLDANADTVNHWECASIMNFTLILDIHLQDILIF